MALKEKDVNICTNPDKVNPAAPQQLERRNKVKQGYHNETPSS